MEQTSLIMKREIRVIANHRALMLSRYFLSILLGIVSLYLGFLRYPVSPLYILLFLNILPSIIKYAIHDYSNKNRNHFITAISAEKPFKLENLKAKYKYSKLVYISNSISYLLAIFLLCLWQINYSNTEIDSIISILPLSILAAGLMSRFLGLFFYRIKLPYDLLHNRI